MHALAALRNWLIPAKYLSLFCSILTFLRRKVGMDWFLRKCNKQRAILCRASNRLPLVHVRTYINRSALKADN